MPEQPLAIVIEANPEVRDLLLEVLRVVHFSARAATFDAVAAAVRGQEVALIVADVSSRLELQAGERRQIAELAALGPVVLLASGNWADYVAAPELGVVRILKHPLGFDALCSAITDAARCVSFT